MIFLDFQMPPTWTAKERKQLDRRLLRLEITEPSVAGAVSKLESLGRRWPATVRIRSRFVYQSEPAPGDASDRKLPDTRDRPPATRLLSPSGIALRFYLTALFAAQIRTRPGKKPINDLPLIAGGSQTGWIDLVAVPVQDQGEGTYVASRATKKQRRVESALKLLSHKDVQLVHLPNQGKVSGKYQGFQLCDEGGFRPDGDVPPYTVPDLAEPTLELPSGLFKNGWIHLLEDTELAFLMMIALASPQGEWIKIKASERLLHYGIGRDAYDAHKTLQAFGLLEVHVDENRHDDGKVMGYGKGGRVYLHAFRLLADGFDEPAAPTIKTVIGRLLRGS